MKRIVEYNNKLNLITFRNFLATDCNYFMFLCSKLRRKKEETITVTFIEIRDAVNLRNISNKELEDELLSLNDKLLATTGRIKDGTKTRQFALFNEFETDSEEQTLKVSVNPKYSYILNEFADGFTLFDFQEFMLLSSRYSKTLYRLLKQWRSKGEYVVTIENLKKYTDCPEDMENRYFMRDVVRKSIKELCEKECFRNLEVKSSRGRKKGGPLTELTFTFDAEDVKKKQKEEQAPEVKPKANHNPKAKAPNTFNTNFQQRKYTNEYLESVCFNTEPPMTTS